MVATPGITQGFDPAAWREHRFGLSEARWGRLRGMRIIISGAGTGYGQCFAIALALAGARVHLMGRRAAKLAQTRDMAIAMGAEPSAVIAHAVDLRDGAATTHAVGEVLAQGSFHGAIANAAMPQTFGGARPLLDAEEDSWTALFDMNVTSQWRLLRLACRAPRGHGFRAVTITSEAGWADTPGFGPYNISKAALNSLTTSLAAECEAAFPGDDIQINCLIPGEARTEMNQGSTEPPWKAVPMTLLLLSHGPGGPNGRFFHRDGRHFPFAYAAPWDRDLVNGMPLG